MSDIEITTDVDSVAFNAQSTRAKSWMELNYGGTAVKYPIGDARSIEEFRKHAERADMTVERTQ
jgi:hypothetical protein